MSEDAHFHPWELGFKQSGLRHITRALRSSTINAFTMLHAFPPTVVSRSCELEDLEGSVHDAAGLATGFGDVASAGEMVGADCEVAQAGHDAGS